ncbi:DUF1036 domain-containing protein [Methylomagnum ishizawai]|uniref:DUF1036 domain-containing protein n=1 Tax=Methylomagnum ishizawai TaxID=1760988 RepID=UPI001594079E|nr:DUF1036 domain-containing protein [Methylomagnum ishizawai]
MTRELMIIVAAFCFSGVGYAAGSVKVCNYLDQNVSFVFGWHDAILPVADGWYTVKGGTCKRLNFPEADTYLPMYAYAISDDGTEYRPRGDSGKFCIKRNDNFDQYGTLACAAIDAAVDATATELNGGKKTKVGL